MNISDVTALRLQVAANGWVPLPVTSPDYQHPKVTKPGKQPFFPGWRSVSAETITPEMIRGWEKLRDHTNTGLITGHLAGADIDVREPNLAMQIDALADALLAPTPLVRIGAAPKQLRVYRHAVPLTKMETPELFLPDGTMAQVEMMGVGQQVVGFGIHPDTRQPYHWLKDSPLDKRFDDIPAIAEQQVRSFLAAAEAAIRAAGGRTQKEIDAAARGPEPTTKPGTSNGAADGASFFKQVNRCALDNLDLWVTRLFPRAKLQQTGAYRVKSADLGRDYQEDLSIHPDGVEDFGPRRKMSPCDLIMEFLGAPNVQAAALTLCEWLNRDPTGFGWKGKASARKQQPNGNAQTNQNQEDTNDGLITEGAVADAFTKEHRNRLRYDHHAGLWHLWDGTRWKRQETKLAYRWAHQRARVLAAVTQNVKAILSAGRAAFASGVERIAQSDTALAVTSAIWDRDPWLLGTPGGTVDLRTGKLQPASQSDYITKLTAVAPADTPDCPRWLKFLNEACNADVALIRFLQQWNGHSLTGSIEEHALLFAHGPGGNGKSVWLNTVANIMGDYCRTAAMDTFTASKYDRHPTELAALKGARMVCASETEEGRAWSEVRIKQLTGGDRIAARFMHRDLFEYTPQFKLTVIGNHVPDLHNVDDAARRRFNLAPFTHKPAVVDRKLEEKLRAEWPGILQWMIVGCLDWQANGLIRPNAVTTSTADYFSDQDLMAQWIDDCCEKTNKDGIPAVDTLASLLASWRSYAKSRGEAPGSSKGFSMALRSRGLVRIRDVDGIRGRGFRGLRVHRDEPAVGCEGGP